MAVAAVAAVPLLWNAGDVGGVAVLGAEAPGRRAAQQLFYEVLAEAFAHQVEGERVDAGVGEGKDAGAYAGDEVTQRRVHLVVVVGAVQVDHVTGHPADSEEADKHQHDFGQAFPGLVLMGKQQKEKSALVALH